MKEINGYPPTKTTPWPHQVEAWRLSKHLPAFMFGHDMGCGKSKTAVDFCNGVDANLVLIVCPNAVVSDVWPEQFATHSAKTFKVVELDDSSVKKKASKLEKEIRVAMAMKISLVVVVNFESIWREPLGPAYNSYNKLLSNGIIKRQPWDVIIVDESHKIKSYKSTISKFMHKLGRTARYRLCLSGTFLDDKPEDIFGQYRFLDDKIFGTSFTAFKGKFIEEYQCGNFSKTKGYKNIDELNLKINSISHRVMKRDVLLNLPPVTHVPLYCHMSKTAMDLYEKFKTDLVVECSGETLSTDTLVVKLLRLSQMAGGYLPLEDPDGKVREFGKVIDTSKMDQLEYILDSTSKTEPVVVFARFSNEIKRIKALIENKGRTCAELSGDMNQLAEWKSGNFNCIAVQIKSGAAGISLVRSCIGVFYSKGYSLGEVAQAYARQDRPGQTRPVTFYHLIAKNTMDELIEKAIETKQNVIQYVLSFHKQQTAITYIKVA